MFWLVAMKQCAYLEGRLLRWDEKQNYALIKSWNENWRLTLRFATNLIIKKEKSHTIDGRLFKFRCEFALIPKCLSNSQDFLFLLLPGASQHHQKQVLHDEYARSKKRESSCQSLQDRKRTSGLLSFLYHFCLQIDAVAEKPITSTKRLCREHPPKHMAAATKPVGHKR
jgi:hypothetical protein